MTPVWRRQLPRARAALLALAITAAFLLALNASLLRPVVTAGPAQRALTVLLLRPQRTMPSIITMPTPGMSPS